MWVTCAEADHRSNQSVGKASLVSILRWYDDSDAFKARVLPESEVVGALSRAMKKYNCNARSPWVTSDDDLRELTQGSRPGQVPRESYDIWKCGGEHLRPTQTMAQSLRVPPRGTVHIVGDSTLKLYPRPSDMPGEKTKGKAVTITHRMSNDKHGIYCTGNNTSGATIQEMTRDLRLMTDETLAGVDCTIVVCMFSAKEANSQLTYTKMSGVSVHVIMLCQELLRHKRAALSMGGRADFWNFGDEWDNMVQKTFSLAVLKAS